MKQYYNRQLEDKDIRELQEGITTVLQLTSDAIASYKAYLFDGRGLVSIKIAQVNGAALQVFIVVQFCKLFETNYQNGEGEASLYKLNNVLRKKYPEWLNIFNANGRLLNNIKKDPMYSKIHLLRNKSYAHSDKHPENPALLFKYFSHNEFDSFVELFKAAIEVFRSCFKIYDITYQDYSTYYNNPTQLRFLKKYNKYKKYYLDNFGTTGNVDSE